MFNHRRNNIPEIDDLLALLNKDDERDPDEIAEDIAAAPVSPGDLWKLGEHLLFCGDAMLTQSYHRLMGGHKADAIWTDPPYNVGYEGKAGKIMNDKMGSDDFRHFIYKAFSGVYENLIAGGPMYVAYADSESMAFRGALTEVGFKIVSCLIWIKDNIVLGRSDYQHCHEPILYGWKPTTAHRWYGGRSQHTVFEIPGVSATLADDGSCLLMSGDDIVRISGDNFMAELLPSSAIHVPKPLKSKLHPTTKPVELIERCLKNSSRPSDIILDPFGGSGSTLIACERLGRRARLMELDSLYAGRIVSRWEEFTGRLAEKVEVGHAEN